MFVFDCIMSIIDFFMENVDFFITQVASARRFCLDLEPDKRSQLSIVSGGVEKCSPDYDNQRENFPYFCLEFVVAGAGELVLNGKKSALAPGCVFSYGPGVPHRITCVHEEPMTKYFVDFAGRRSLKIFETASLFPGSFGMVKNPGEVVDAFQNIVKYGCQGGRHASEICALQLEILALVMKDNVAPCGSSAARALASFQKLKELIDTGYLKFRSLEEIADAGNINPAYLCRLFKKFEGETPYKHLVRLKMRHAANLLQEGNMLVKEVALTLNFEDPYQFSKMFKRVYGVSPEKFAKLTARLE